MVVEVSLQYLRRVSGMQETRARRAQVALVVVCVLRSVPCMQDAVLADAKSCVVRVPVCEAYAHRRLVVQ